MTGLPASRSGRTALAVARAAALAAGEILKARFHQEKQVQRKGRGNLVTDVDLEVETNLRSLLGTEYPRFGILGEESAASGGQSDYTWIIDPLDGTTNYARGIPFFAVAIALARGDDVLLGLVHDPLKGEQFWAAKGAGAYCNSEPIRVSAKRRVKAAVIGLDLGYVDERGKRVLKLVGDLFPGMQSVRIMGSGALGLAYAACGRIDLYIHPLLYPWELGCGTLLVTEAGGEITDWSGVPTGVRQSGAIAANRALHDDFLRHVSPQLMP